MPRFLPLLLACSSGALAAPLATLSFDAAILARPVRVVERTLARDEWTGAVLPPHAALAFGPPARPSGDLDVFDVAELLQANGADDGHLHWLDVPWNVKQLHKMLEQRAATSSTPGPFPFVPLVVGDQAVHAAVKYLDFGGLHGVRYVTAFTTRFDRPLDDRALLYTFQGFTSDGTFLVSWRQPLELPDVLATGPVAQWDAYKTATTKLLDAFTNDTRLTILDRFLATLHVR
ncbi:hypothetical protein [Deinococcus yavapaiensis]|nr:hypothetical protein [Deinococcus yavapaiensis]